MATNSNNNGKHLREYFKNVDKVMKQKGAKDLSGKTVRAEPKSPKQIPWSKTDFGQTRKGTLGDGRNYRVTKSKSKTESVVATPKGLYTRTKRNETKKA